MRLNVYRYKDTGKQTQSNAVVIGNRGRTLFRCSILELSWKDNQQMISCIPPGEYEVVLRRPGENGSKFKYWHYEVLNVPGRYLIKIHRANFHDQLLGCLAPGRNFQHIGHDEQLDVSASAATLQQLVNILGQKFVLGIFGIPEQEIVETRKPEPIPVKKEPKPKPFSGTRNKKGQFVGSGNKKGRPKGTKNKPRKQRSRKKDKKS